jgi:hypothetical protein
MGPPAEVVLAMQANLVVVATLSTQIGLLEKRLAETVGPRAEYALLTRAPGIGRILASVILLETGIHAVESGPCEDASPGSIRPSSKSGSATIERLFGWEDKFRGLLLRFERLCQLHCAFTVKILPIR